MRCSKRTGRHWGLASAAPRTRMRAGAGARGAAIKPLPAIRPEVDRRVLESLGDGGFLTWKSSPSFMWLAARIARAGE